MQSQRDCLAAYFMFSSIFVFVGMSECPVKYWRSWKGGRAHRAGLANPIEDHSLACGKRKDYPRTHQTTKMYVQNQYFYCFGQVVLGALLSYSSNQQCCQCSRRPRLAAGWSNYIHHRIFWIIISNKNVLENIKFTHILLILCGRFRHFMVLEGSKV